MNTAQTISRRRMLRGSLAAAAALGLPALGPAQELARGIRLLSGPANGLAYSTPDGTILIDAPAPQTRDATLQYSDAMVLFNTNWRAEHTGANDALGAQGARIIAHENTRLWMNNDFTVRWEQRRYTPRAKAALPNDTFYTHGSLEFGTEQIDYTHLPRAHTDGDICVFFRQANILAVSDLLAVEGFPIVDYSTGGWISGLRDATARLIGIADDATVIIPAIGAPQRRPALEAQLELCDAAIEAVGQAYVDALSLDELLARRPLEAWAATRGDPGPFLAQAYRSAWGHIRSMGLGVV